MSLFQKASKKEAKLRLGLVGPAGSGKTFSALKIGRALVGPNGRIAVIDTEHGSAAKYSDVFDFDTAQLDSFDPLNYINYLRAAEKAGYDLIIIDSLSHAWNGKDGILEQVDRSGNKFGQGWKDATPKQNELIDTILATRAHVIVTLRSKTAYEVEKDEKGKTTIKKLGLQPVQREGVDYEFDIVGDMHDATLAIGKTRCSKLSGKVFMQPGEEFAEIVSAWLKGEPEITDEMMKRLHAIGHGLYGNDWDEKRHAFVQFVTNDRFSSSHDLTRAQYDQIISMLEERQKYEEYGQAIYAESWSDKSRELCKAISKGRTHERDGLNRTELGALLNGLWDRRNAALKMVSGDGHVTEPA